MSDTPQLTKVCHCTLPYIDPEACSRCGSAHGMTIAEYTHYSGPMCYTPEKCRQLERDLAAMTAERDAVLDDSIVGRDAALKQINDLERQLAAMTAERDELYTKANANPCSHYHTTDAVLKLTAERDRAIAAHAQCDRDRQAALDRVRELEKSACGSTHMRMCEDASKSEYRDRLDRMVAACVMDGRGGDKDIVGNAIEFLAAIDAAVEKRNKHVKI